MIKGNLHRTFVSRGILKSTTLRNHFVVQTTTKFGAKKPKHHSIMDGKDAKAMKQTSVRSVGDEKSVRQFQSNIPQTFEDNYIFMQLQSCLYAALMRETKCRGEAKYSMMSNIT